MNSILCVDDDETGLNIRVLLLRSFGFEVLGTTEPDKAMRLLQSRDFDIVVVDYFLSTTTGTVLAKAMKQRRPSQICLLLSGLAEVPAGLENVDGFLCKTGSPLELVATIRGLINSKQSKAA